MPQLSAVLVNPPLFWGHLSHFEATRRSLPSADDLAFYPGEHLGLGSIAGYCRSRGQAVAIVNGLVAEHVSVGETFDLIKARIDGEGVPLLNGFSGTSLVFQAMRALVRRCKTAWPTVRIILGYDFATLNYAEIMELEPSVDYVCRGEGERVFSKLIDCLASGADTSSIAGLVYRAGDGRILGNEPKAMDINELPRVARDELAEVLAKGFGAGVIASRGCPYRCSYCSLGETSSLYGKDAYRHRDIERVVDEIEYMQRDFRVDTVTIVDDLFLTRSPSSQSRAEAFADLMVQRNVKVRWMMDCRVDSIERKLFQRLHAAGLRKIFVGIESPDPEVLARYNKRYLIKQERPAQRVRQAIDAGVEVVPGILTYDPHTTARSLRAVLDCIDELDWKGKYQLMNRVRAYPGTPLYEQYRAAGLLQKGRWPNLEWVYDDPRVEDVAKRVSQVAMQPDSLYADVRGVFLAAIESLETNLHATPLGPLDAASAAAIAAGLETEGDGERN